MKLANQCRKYNWRIQGSPEIVGSLSGAWNLCENNIIKNGPIVLYSSITRLFE